MIITKLFAGMGNQMFQYAAGKSLAIKWNVPLKLDLQSYKEDDFREFELHYFEIVDEVASENEIAKMTDQPNNFILQKLHAFNQRISKKEDKITLLNETSFKYDGRIEEASKNTYLNGHWQHFKYFESVSNEIRSLFQFKQCYNYDFLAIYEKINKSECSVAIHTRRTDYHSSALNYTLSIDYYQEAIQLIERKLQKNCTFFVFGEDVVWNQQMFGEMPNTSIICSNWPAAFDMQLISMCNHQIIANSTYSWWGAWLNANTEKLVIMPKQWFKEGAVWYNNEIPDTTGLYPMGWLTI
ncbi:MAG: alpha-1,2-fucosyltransferase [Bacteroidota bacterium]|nr:alpha-1,2-fucosyltransferase [Bacteroidota bacterium]